MSAFADAVPGRVAELEGIASAQAHSFEANERRIAAVRELAAIARDAEQRAEAERKARKAVEAVNADEVLRRRTNLEAIIASEQARAESAEQQVRSAVDMLAAAEKIAPGLIATSGRFALGDVAEARARATSAEAARENVDHAEALLTRDPFGEAERSLAATLLREALAPIERAETWAAEMERVLRELVDAVRVLDVMLREPAAEGLMSAEDYRAYLQGAWLGVDEKVEQARATFSAREEAQT